MGNLLRTTGWVKTALLVLMLIYASTSEETGDGNRRRISNFADNPKHRVRVERDETPVNVTDNDDEDGYNSSFALPAINSKIKYQKFELPENYNRLQIPSGLLYSILSGTLPDELFTFELFNELKVTVTLRIRNINEVDEADEEVTFAADLVLEWVDEFILYSSMAKYKVDSVEIRAENRDDFFKTLDASVLDEIWKPDIFIENLVKVQHPEVMSQPVTVRVNEITGQVIYVSRLRIQLECEMDFHYYPADTQFCEVMIRSNSYSVDELKLEWADPYGIHLDDCTGSNYNYQLVPSVFDDEETKIEAYSGNKTRTFSILPFAIAARRKLSYHMVQTFLPSLFFILITWLCFLVPARMVEARIGIAMTTLLTLTAMFASVRESTPSVSYVRAIDIWMIACIFFVFLTLLEFTVVLWLRNNKEEMDEEKAEEDNKAGSKVEGTDETSIEFKQANEEKSETRKSIQFRRKKAEMQNNISEFIEKYAFIMFSVIFFIFSLTFWSWMLIGSSYFTWSNSANREVNCPDQVES